MLKYPMFTTFSAHAKKAGQQARARRGVRGVWPFNYQRVGAHNKGPQNVHSCLHQTCLLYKGNGSDQIGASKVDQT